MNIHTLGELRASGYKVRSVKDEMRGNLLARIARGESTFPGIHGYERTVIPAVHNGIIPRTNRGIFAINELPDLAPRIQVALLNILEERDLQIRGFPIRIPMDVVLVFSANPEDYTSRGNIITPLKDRIDSQILTHYPQSIDTARRITEQEAWTDREDGAKVEIPPYVRDLIENIAFVARESELVDQSSGVSARLTIAAMELLQSNLERRSAMTGDKHVFPRLSDLAMLLPAI